MASGCLIVQPDKSLILEKLLADNPSEVEAQLLAFSHPTGREEALATFEITEKTIWKARRNGLSLEEILNRLKVYSRTEIPQNVLQELKDWSEKIDRLTLIHENHKLVLKSDDSLVLTEIFHHKQLGKVVKTQIDEHTLELKLERYRSLQTLFDRHRFPFLDQTEGDLASRPRRRQRRKQGGRVKLEVLQDVPPSREDLEPDTGRCQAMTRAGRRCRNRARPGSEFCQVHGRLHPTDPEIPQQALGMLADAMIKSGMVTLKQLALMRLGMLAISGLATWIFYSLFVWLGKTWLEMDLALWYTLPLAFVAALAALGRLPLVFGAHFGMHACLMLFISCLLDVLGDFFNKEGLILNICFILFPFILPGYVLYAYSLSFWWGLLLFPAGLIGGLIFYAILDFE